MSDERTTWQSTPAPKMMRIMTPKNSAAGSLMYSLSGGEYGFVADETQKAYRYLDHLFGYRV